MATETTAKDLEQRLMELLGELRYMDAEDLDQACLNMAGTLEGAAIETFENAGLMTTDAGLTIQLANGPKFQLTIVEA